MQNCVFVLVWVGCRYGCICHLCSIADIYSENASLQYDPQLPSPPLPNPTCLSSLPCGKVHCRLGCVCDSLNGSKVTEATDTKVKHCGRAECMFTCNCHRKTRSATRSLLWAGNAMGNSDSVRAESPVVTPVRRGLASPRPEEMVKEGTKEVVSSYTQNQRYRL